MGGSSSAAPLAGRSGWALARFSLLALPLAVTALAARRQLAPDGIGVDDAFIFLRYGRNLAAGHGWVWNPGGELVEGTTSPLWTLVVAAGFSVTQAPATLLFAVALAAVAAALALWSAEAGAAGAPAGAAGWLGVALTLDLLARPGFVMRTVVSLMDGGLWCAAALVAAATLARAARPGAPARALAAAGAAQVALALARPESLLVGPALVLAAAVACRGAARAGAAALAAAGAAQLALVSWRLSTFGWPAPNTFYAKVGDDLAKRLEDGLALLAGAARQDPTYFVLWPLAVAVLGRCAWRSWVRRRADDQRDPALALAATGALLGPAIVLLEGGGYRTLLPLRPFAATLGFLVVARLVVGRAGARRAAPLAAAAFALASAAAYLHDGARWARLAATSPLEDEFELARRGLHRGELLNALLADAARAPAVGVLAAGGLPFAYRGPSVDLLGLNHPAMAHATRRRAGLFGHSAFSAEVFFAAPPELLFVSVRRCAPALATGGRRRIIFRRALADLDRDPRFTARFAFVRLVAADEPTRALCAFARRDFLASGAGGALWEPIAETAGEGGEGLRAAATSGPPAS